METNDRISICKKTRSVKHVYPVWVCLRALSWAYVCFRGHACTERKHVHFLATFSGKSTPKMRALKSSSKELHSSFMIYYCLHSLGARTTLPMDAIRLGSNCKHVQYGPGLVEILTEIYSTVKSNTYRRGWKE